MHLARRPLALALLVVQAPAMALLVKLYVISLRLQPTRPGENSKKKKKKKSENDEETERLAGAEMISGESREELGTQ